MKKLILFIIGMAIFTGAPFAFAQVSCNPYADEFNCGDVIDYCSLRSEINADDGGMDIYRSLYCNISKDSKDELYELVAEQLSVEDPNWGDPDIIKYILEDFNKESINAYLDKKYGSIEVSKLPNDLKTFIKRDQESAIKEVDQLYRVQQRIKLVFDREKIMRQTRESLKSQFKISEMWVNGKIEFDGSAPFDLITDLNLIEIILFGSEAQWMDDVYSFPDQGSEEVEIDGDGDETDADAGEEEGSSAPDTPGTDGTDSAAGERIEEEYLCVPNDTIQALLENEDDADQLANQLIGGQPASLEPGEVPEGCGNGIMEGEEQCDDGNLIAGDGCSISCENEPCSSEDCPDPDAVTFSQLPPAVKDAVTTKSIAEILAEGREGADIPDCGEGAAALTQAEFDALTGPPPPIEQLPNFNTNVGGILQNFPASKKPPCPLGHSTLQITVAGKTFFTCIQTEVCADFKDARKLLFGEDYEEDPIKKEAANAIEAMICIDVKKIMRPQSPYPLSEGCIDCHILGMIDSLDEVISKNVAPLENSMSAWGLSNRWGPSISFDLASGIGPKVYIKPISAYVSPAEDIEREIKEINQEARGSLDSNREPRITSVTKGADGSETLNIKLETGEKAEKSYYEHLKNYNSISAARADLSTYSTISPLLSQMLKSFESINGKFIGITLSTELHKKDKCKFQ